MRFFRSRWSTWSSSSSCSGRCSSFSAERSSTGSGAARRAAPRPAPASRSSARPPGARSGSCQASPERAAEDVPVQMEDRLPGAGAARRSSAGTPRGPRPRGRLGDEIEHPLRLVGARASPTSRNVSMCRSGSTSRCASAFGAMSSIATKPVGAVDDGRRQLAATMLQKMQSSTLTRPGSPPRVTAAAAHAHEVADRRRRRATASSRRRTRGPGGRRGRRPLRRPSLRQRRRQASCDSARSRALRSLFTAGGTVSLGGRPCPAAASTGRRAPSSAPAALDDARACARTRLRPRRGSRRSRRSSG